MKKQYMMPQTMVVELNNENILEGSPRLYNVDATGDAMSNDRDSYDDDEDLW